MAEENYLLHRARLILTELKQEHRRVDKINPTVKSAEVMAVLEIVKSKMREVEAGIKLLENLP